ncbi:MAG: integration host factor subunit alpha [Hyphomicrobiales bacterium]|nr:integration host factor subunit alpha [Hyphomicrobiales bacterium]MDE2017372.1 integration host factor subunit alpha [Hyphomicrobiales bacterium]
MTDRGNADRGQDAANAGATTRADLARAVQRKVGLSQTESAELVEQMLDQISVTLERGDGVKLSSFGTFKIRHKRERTGRNPKTGVEAAITPRRVLVFKASNQMKAKINGVEPTGDDDED